MRPLLLIALLVTSGALSNIVKTDSEENAEINEEDVDARGLEDAWKEEDLADEPPQENTEEARSLEDDTEEARALEDDTEEARALEDDTGAFGETEDDVAARSMGEEVEPGFDEDMAADAREEELDARDLASADGTAEDVGKRSSIEMALILNRYIGIGNAAKLLRYGCFCGVGGSGKTPVDSLDKCCQIHDQCYADGTKGSFWTRKCKIDFKLKLYRYKCMGSTCFCTSKYKSCAWKACKCDVDFAKCVKAHWSSYNPAHRFIRWKCK